MPDKYTEDYIKDLEKAYEEERRIRRFFARPPPKTKSALLRPNLGGGMSVSTNVAVGQSSPVATGPINFTVTFSEPTAADFTSADVSTAGSTVGGTLTPTVTGGPTTYNVAVAGMTGNGAVVINIPAGSATNAKGQPFPASAGSATVVLDTTRPSVTIAAAAGQPDPAGFPPITFTVTFSETVTGFLASDVVITGTAGGTKTVSLNGYNAEVTGMTTAGTVIATVPVNAVADLAGNLSTASNSATVNWLPDITRPNVTINQGASQSDPTGVSPILFEVVFTEPVTGFTNTDVTVVFSGGGTPTVTVTPLTSSTYTVSVTGMTTAGTVTASIAANVCTDLSGNLNFASTSTDNVVTWFVADVTAPTVTINQAAGQVDPTSASPIQFTAVFSEAVIGFTNADIAFTGSTAGGTLAASISGTGPTYTVSVTGMTTDGNVVVSIPAGVVTDAASNPNTASTSTDNVVTWIAPDVTAPTVTINQAAGQADPTSSAPILFTAVFSEAVTGFTSGDISFAGSTAGGTLVAALSGTGPTYTVSVTGMTTSGNVVVSIPAASVIDLSGNASTASTSSDSTVTWVATGGTDGQLDFSLVTQSGLQTIVLLEDI